MRGGYFLLALALLLLTGCGGESGAHPAPAPPPERAPAIQDSAPPETGEGAGSVPTETDGPADSAAPATDEPADSAPPETDPITEESTMPEPTQSQTPADETFVRGTDYSPGVQVDLRYAAADNFTGQTIYDFTDAWLRYGTVRKLAKAQEALAAQGYGLKIWDAFRPPAAQFVMWEICPNGDYVADPTRGFSNHSRGNTVDVTLISAEGEELAMPTGFDDFSGKADRDYSDVDDQEAVANVLVLEQAMEEAGFDPYVGEWWHFVDSDRYPVEEEFQPPAGTE